VFKAGSRRIRDAANAAGGTSNSVFPGVAASHRGADATSGRPPSTVDAALVNQLVELGFQRDLASIALAEAGGDIVRAVDLLTR
jgi:UBA/TS-N domain